MMLLCANLLKYPTLARIRRYLPTPFGNLKVHRRSVIYGRLVKGLSGIMVFFGPYLVTYWWYTPRKRLEPTPISQFLGILQQVHIMQDILTHHLQNQWTTVGLSVSQWSGEISLHSMGLFNRFTHSSILRTTRWHLSVGLKQTRLCQNARIWIWIPYRRYRSCYV